MCWRGHSSAEEILEGQCKPDLLKIPFRDPNHFKAGEIHKHYREWVRVVGEHSDQSKLDVLKVIAEKVNIFDYMCPFKGNFKGIYFDSDVPPSYNFRNSKSCDRFRGFVNSEIERRLITGAISETKIRPYLVSPLTVEPSKPRLCLDLRFLNNWMVDTPFTLDSLNEVPRIVSKNSLLTKLDDKSGYDHVLVSERSKQYFGFEWESKYFVCNTIPFGWKNSAFIYHNLNLAVASYLRSLNVNNLIYIDDRLVGEVMGFNGSSTERANAAIYAACQIVLRLGYFIGLGKSMFVPSTSIIYLGMIIDTDKQAFVVPESKKNSFIELRESILEKKTVSLLEVQKFVGKCISFTLAIPGAKLFTSEACRSISYCIKTDSNLISIGNLFRDELEIWRFLDTWDGYMPWKEEKHLILNLTTDASNFRWAGNINIDGDIQEFGDYWDALYLGMPIVVKEAYAILFSLQAIQSLCYDVRIRVFSDSKVFIDAWDNQGSRSSMLIEVLKKIFFFIKRNRIYLQFKFVPSNENSADHFSRILSKEDAMLSRVAWDRVKQSSLEEYTVDLMAIDSNSQLKKHFTPHFTPDTSGVDLFAQTNLQREVCYVFPPLSMIMSVIAFFEQQNLKGTIIVPLFELKPVWWPKLVYLSSYSFILGFKGDKDILLYPSKKGFFRDKKGLPWDLLAFHIGLQHMANLVTCHSCIVSKILVGDSILRAINEGEVSQARVFAFSGARIETICHHVMGIINEFRPLYCFIHVGINDILSNRYVSKLKYLPYCNHLFNILDEARCRFNVTIIISGVLLADRKDCGAGINTLNKILMTKCAFFRFHYVAHDIQPANLTDGLHLNASGVSRFCKDLGIL